MNRVSVVGFLDEGLLVGGMISFTGLDVSVVGFLDEGLLTIKKPLFMEALMFQWLDF
ncbi:TPA: hypothetical protein I9781_001919 [Legionella pneumophila]|nr:hypothetical protein [Legionella pneumophila]HAT5027813.1 hypothetical protein [Legionella pneumophila]HAT5041469.1 hypothetical protein [Legionella pneumophila]HAT5052149.1 hypothetical protein [Legionella pneumophila]HAT5054566.1 hypothetical protein [Legionella pneumophila]